MTVAIASGCGESAHQDAAEPKGAFTVQVTSASFPKRQAVSKPEQLVLRIHNPSRRTVPNVAVAVNSFDYVSNYPNLAARLRPVWVVDNGPGPIAKPPVETVEVDAPGGATTATYNVWALGPLAPGATHSFVWRVSPVKSGVHQVFYRVFGGLNGRARAVLANGRVPGGSFTVAIGKSPPRRHVNPQSGKVELGVYSPS